MKRVGIKKWVTIAIIISVLPFYFSVSENNTSIISFSVIAKEEQNKEENHSDDDKMNDAYDHTLGVSFEGYTLFSPEWTKQTCLINDQNQLVHSWNSKRIQALGTYLLEDGNLIRTSFPNINNTIFAGGGSQEELRFLI